MKQIGTPTKIITATVLLAGTLFFPAKALEEKIIKPARVAGVSATKEQPYINPAPEFLNSPVTPELTAKAAYAFDVNSGTILYTSNFDEALPIASLSKLMTALLVLEKRDLNSIMVVTKEDTTVIGTNMGLLAEERIKVLNVLKGMLISSSNDAAKSLARTTSVTEQRFVSLMNERALALGMTQTRFTNPTGLDGLDNIDNNYSSAFDLSLLLTELNKHEIFSEIVKTREEEVTSTNNYIVHRLHTTNKLMLENPEVVGIKTGFTSLAKGNLIIHQNHNGTEIVTIVLGSDNREEDTKKLIEWIFNAYRW